MSMPIRSSSTTALPFALCGILLLLTGCQGRESISPAPGPVAMSPQEHETWEIALVEMRIAKNEEFEDPSRTPLPQDAIAGFAGLNYYYPAPGLRFRTPLLEAASADTVLLTKRKGQQVPYRTRGRVRFRYNDQDFELKVYGPVDTRGGDYLWLPFFDATSGHETYGGGRYLDLEPDADGMIDLDFNYAYNPLCDYNPDRFNCTLPPAQNKLPFAVEAGEMIFGALH